jgi:hypothetical protein
MLLSRPQPEKRGLPSDTRLVVSGGKYRLPDTELAKLGKRYRRCSYANAAGDCQFKVRYGSTRFDPLEILAGEFWNRP